MERKVRTMLLKRFCNKSGCKNITTERYCPEHTFSVEHQKKERHRHYDKYQRDQKAAGFYNSKEWERARQQALVRDNGLCQDCLDQMLMTSADVVDHIKPIKHFWNLRLTLSNLRSLCHAHHNRKTAEDKRRYERGLI